MDCPCFCVDKELREKNWKAMDALSEMEKNMNNKVKSAVQKVKVLTLPNPSPES